MIFPLDNRHFITDSKKPFSFSSVKSIWNELMIAQGAETYNTICDKSFDSDIVHISVLISTYPTPIIINKAPICVASEIAKSISLTP